MESGPTCRRPAQAGFSLIELLVVISVIAVLAALLLPTVGVVRQSALASACRSNLRQVGIATAAYAGDWEGILPPAELPPRGAGGRICWAYTLSPYLDQDNPPDELAASWAKATWCPIFRRSDANAAWDSGLGINDRPGQNYTSPLCSVFRAGYTWSSPDPTFTFWHTSQIQLSSQRILAGDAYLRADHVLRLHPLGSAYVLTNWAFTAPATVDDRADGDPLRHRGRANYLFCDGHVSSLDAGNAALGLSNPAAMTSP